MAQMYFSKFNINSEIYEIYEDDSIRVKILDDILNKMDTDIIYEEEKGNENYRYKFCDLEKNVNDRTVTGRLVKIFTGEVQSYNDQEDTVDIRESEDCASSCTFHFDLKTEQIAFITRRDFGYNQFNQYFKILLEMHIESITFEMFLENNINELRKKIYNFKKIISTEVVIIPPNANTDDFEALFGTSADEFRESNATKYTQRLDIPSRNDKGINPKTNFFERMFFGIAKGYGEMTVKGKDQNKENITITSAEDTPYKKTIPDNEKDSIIAFAERGATAIIELVSKKMELRVNDKKENKNENENENEN